MCPGHMSMGSFLLSNRGGGGHPTASLIYPTGCFCLGPAVSVNTHIVCGHARTHTCTNVLPYTQCRWLIFCQMLLLSFYPIAAEFGLTPEVQRASVWVCVCLFVETERWVWSLFAVNICRASSLPHTDLVYYTSTHTHTHGLCWPIISTGGRADI